VRVLLMVEIIADGVRGRQDAACTPGIEMPVYPEKVTP